MVGGAAGTGVAANISRQQNPRDMALRRMRQP
jgi:hypothetical protein